MLVRTVINTIGDTSHGMWANLAHHLLYSTFTSLYRYQYEHSYYSGFRVNRKSFIWRSMSGSDPMLHMTTSTRTKDRTD